MKQKFITTAEAAKKWEVSQSDVLKACREGYISEALKNEKGVWKIPSNAKDPFSDSKSAQISNKKENIIAAAIMIVIVVISLITIGIDPIKQWFTEPIVWKDADFVNVQLINKEEESEDRLKLQFAVENNSENPFNYYTFLCRIDSVTFELSSSDYIMPNNIAVIDRTMTTNGFGLSKIKVDEKTYNSIKNTNLENVDFSYKIKLLDSNGKNLVKNNGVFKVILLFVVSAVLGVLGFTNVIKLSWLRIIFKICGMPAIIIVVTIIFAIAALGGGSNSQSQSQTSGSARNTAAKNYKREANLKAGAIITGNQKEAASSQARMDKNMADMIMGDKSSVAKTNYKRAADAKAGFVRTGNQKEAAKAQAQMDRYLSDMINESKDE